MGANAEGVIKSLTSGQASQTSKSLPTEEQTEALVSPPRTKRTSQSPEANRTPKSPRQDHSTFAGEERAQVAESLHARIEHLQMADDQSVTHEDDDDGADMLHDDDDTQVAGGSMVGQGQPEEDEAGGEPHSQLAFGSSNAKGKSKMDVKIPLNAVARNSDNTGWVELEDAGKAGTLFEKEHKKMARTGSKSVAEYRRMINSEEKYSSGDVCLQCLVVAHNRNLCDLKGNDYACTRCARLGLPCPRLMWHDGELTVAFQPLEQQHRVNRKWDEPEYWVNKSLNIPRPQITPVSRKKSQREADSTSKRLTRAEEKKAQGSG